MDYKPVVVRRHAKPAHNKHNAESRHWRQFKHPVFVKEYAPVTSVHFSSSKPHRYVVTAATRVQIYAPRTQKVTKTISRFKDVARSGHIRQDGKLVVAGDDTGLVQVNKLRIPCFTWHLNIWTDVITYNANILLVRYSTLIQGRFCAHLTLTSSPCMLQNSPRLIKPRC